MLDSIQATLVYPIHKNHVLLAKKTRKRGIGKWNGFGGEVKKGEGILEAAIRELEEESGLVASKIDLNLVGVLDFYNELIGGGSERVRVFAFLLRKWEGRLKVKDGMKDPRWFPFNKLPPDEELMPADPKFLSHLLAGRKTTIRARYSPNQENLIGKVVVDHPDSLAVYMTYSHFY